MSKFSTRVTKCYIIDKNGIEHWKCTVRMFKHNIMTYMTCCAVIIICYRIIYYNKTFILDDFYSGVVS